MKLKIIIISLFLSLQACKTDPVLPNNPDYLLFGTFYGMCDGPKCITIFKIENEQLSKNNSQYRPSSTSMYMGTFTQLSTDKYIIAKNIESAFPDTLLAISNPVIGCPDCADGGGFYVEYSKNGITMNWLIDTNKSNVPEVLHDFIDKIWEKMELLE